MSDYSQLVGNAPKSSSGEMVIKNQGAAKGFSRVSQFWMPNCITYEQAIDNLEKERKNRKDITSAWKDWKFSLNGSSLQLENKSGEVFQPTEHALMQAIKYCSVSQTHIKQTLDPAFEADDEDLNQLVELLNYRKQRHDKAKEEERNLIFRTYNDSTLRAVLTTSYAPVDNRWFIEVMRDLIPGGMISHQRGNSDEIYCNILLPDNVRNEEDSDYGGMFSIRNSEIGTASLDVCPSLFRAICRNGCIHQETRGINLRQVHKGKIELDKLAVAIGTNLDEQIKLLPSIMDSFLALRAFEFKDVPMKNIFAQIASDSGMTKEQSEEMISEWINKEKTKTAFGVVNAITRMSQNMPPSIGNSFDIYAGNLISMDWNKIVNKAKSLTQPDIDKIFHIKATKVAV